jgi:parallel beta-helix repeat protein
MIYIIKNILLTAFLIPSVVEANNYYISNQGNDHNSGQSVTEPFQNIERINDLELQPGDSILFRSGDVFVGELYIKQSGTENQAIAITSYGSGQDPVIQGSITLTDWQQTAENHYQTSYNKKIHQLYVDGRLQTLARYPDNNYLRIDQPDSTYLYDDELYASNTDLKGTTLKVLTANWQWENRTITRKENNRLVLDSLVWRPFKKGFGYYLENHPSFLDQSGEWYQDKESGEVKIITNANLNNQTVRGTILDAGIRIVDNAEYIEISNLTIRDFNKSGIIVGENTQHITITNIEINNTEIYGIKLMLNATACIIRNNHISDLRGIGISLLEAQNCLVENNIIRKIGLIPGYGFDGVNNGTGIALINTEFRAEDYTRVSENNTIRYNIIDSTGYNGIRADGKYNLIEKNIVTDAVLTMNDGGGIYCWALPDNYDYTRNNTFRGNIVRRVHGNTTASGGDHNMTTAFYMDNFSNNILLEGNMAADCEKGFLLNDCSFGISLKNNLSYNNGEGVVIDVYKSDSTIIRGNHTITHNTFFLTSAEQVAIELKNQVLHQYNPGLIDFNHFISRTYATLNRYFEKTDGVETSIDYTLEKWQELQGFDLNSTGEYPVKGDRWWEIKDRSNLLINHSAETKTWSFAVEKYITLTGEWVQDITLSPFTAILIEDAE